MQPQATVVSPMMVSSTPQQPQIKEHFMNKCVMGMSAAQVGIGILCIILQFALICIHSPISSVGQGIWTGIFFILSGSFGIVSSQKRTTCPIVAFLVLSIISAVLTVGLITPSAIEWSFSSEYYYYRDRNLPAVGIAATLVFMAIMEAVLAIVSSALACHGLCCGQKTPQTIIVAGQVQYIPGPNGQQQVVIVPFNQQGAAMQASNSTYTPLMMPPSAPNPVQAWAGTAMATNATAQAGQPAYYNGTRTPPPEYKEETKVALAE